MTDDDHPERSQQNALDYAMGTIRTMSSYRVAQTVGGSEDRVRPDEAEVTFGINLAAAATIFQKRRRGGLR